LKRQDGEVVRLTHGERCVRGDRDDARYGIVGHGRREPRARLAREHERLPGDAGGHQEPVERELDDGAARGERLGEPDVGDEVNRRAHALRLIRRPARVAARQDRDRGDGDETDEPTGEQTGDNDPADQLSA
jgi:hypothetical protein